MLIIFSGSGSKNFEFPGPGRSWFDYEKSGKNIIYKKDSLMSPIIATGASSENFCGIYHEAGVFKRLLLAMGFKKELSNFIFRKTKELFAIITLHINCCFVWIEKFFFIIEIEIS